MVLAFMCSSMMHVELISGCAGSSWLHVGFHGCGEWRLLFTVVRKFPIVVASLVGLWVWASVFAACWFSCRDLRALHCGLSGCGEQAEWLYGRWNLPQSGTEPSPPALEGGVLTTGLQGKPLEVLFVLSLMFHNISY